MIKTTVDMGKGIPLFPNEKPIGHQYKEVKVLLLDAIAILQKNGVDTKLIGKTEYLEDINENGEVVAAGWEITTVKNHAIDNSQKDEFGIEPIAKTVDTYRMWLFPQSNFEEDTFWEECYDTDFFDSTGYRIDPAMESFESYWY